MMKVKVGDELAVKDLRAGDHDRRDVIAEVPQVPVGEIPGDPVRPTPGQRSTSTHDKPADS
jgi:hypothetical protein